MRFLLFTLFCSGFFLAKSQLSSHSQEGEKAFKITLFKGKMTNEWSQKVENESFGAIILDLSYSRFTHGYFKFQSSHRLKILGDIIALLYTDPGFDKPTPGTPTLTSVFGWHNYGISLFSTSHFQLGAGGHIGDYFYGVEGLHPSDRKSTENTSGTIYYYGGYGPTLFADLALFNSEVILHYEGSYVYTFGGKPVLPDVQPNLLNQYFELRYNRIFFNTELVYGLNTTGNRIARRQFGIGVSLLN